MKIDVPRDKIADFCRKWKIAEMALFGSALRDDFGPHSDIDVLIEFEPDMPWSLYEWVDIIEELGTILGRNVDLVEKSGLRNPFRRDEILRTKEVIYAA